jgi:hypothetical protein
MKHRFLHPLWLLLLSLPLHFAGLSAQKQNSSTIPESLLNRPHTGVVASDGFVPEPEGPALDRSNGGTGFILPWELGGFNARSADNFKVLTNSIPGASVRTTGGCVTSAPTAAISGLHRYLEDTLLPLPVGTSVWYISILFRPSEPLGKGAFNGFFGLTLDDETFIGKPGDGAVNEWVIEGRGGENQVASGKRLAAGRTDVLVVRVDYNRPRRLSLWVNPAGRTTEPAKPDAVHEGLPSSIGRIGLYSTGGFMADELRVGRTYADVVPAP